MASSLRIKKFTIDKFGDLLVIFSCAVQASEARACIQGVSKVMAPILMEPRKQTWKSKYKVLDLTPLAI